MMSLTSSNLTDGAWSFSGGTAYPVLIAFLRPLAVTASATPTATRVYDGTAGTTGISGSIFTTSMPTDGTLSGSLSYGGAASTAKNASTTPYVLVPSGLVSTSQSGFYLYSYLNGLMTITKRPISVAVTRVYDGTTGNGVVPVSTGVSGEMLTLTGNGSVASANVSAGFQTLLQGSLALGNGTGLASNYTLNTSGSTATITPQALTASATVSKTYDGSTSVTPLLTITSGLVGSETVTASATGTLNSKDVATATSVTVNTTSLSNGSNGGLAGNYSLAPGATGTASVTAVALTVTAINQSKVLGSADPILSYNAALLGSDTAATVFGGRLTRVAGENVGSYAINQGSLQSLTSDYTLAFTPAIFRIAPLGFNTGDIDLATLAGFILTQVASLKSPEFVDDDILGKRRRSHIDKGVLPRLEIDGEGIRLPLTRLASLP